MNRPYVVEIDVSGDSLKHFTHLLIPARSGSKRLRAKSLRALGGVPLLARTVQCATAAARRLPNPAHVIVSTDDPEYAQEARAFGATVPGLRPAELATDDARSIDVIRHALRHFADASAPPTEVVLLQPTSPLRTPADVLAAIQAFRTDPTVPLVTVTDPANAPPDHCFDLRGDRLVERGNGDATVALNGAVYVFAPAWVDLHDRLVAPGQTRALRMPPERSVDVDTLADLRRAQALWDQQQPWPSGRCFVIAEAGVNHNGDLDLARRLIDAAAGAGADAVKFQTFSAADLVTAQTPKAKYQQQRTGASDSQFDMLKRLELSRDDHAMLRDHCQARGIAFLSSAFGTADVDLLAELDVAAIKLGSGEVTNLPLLAHSADALRPIILSTGMATLAEVAEAVRVLRVGGCDQLALLHCVSSYPAPPDEINLRAMDTMAAAFDVPVGFSDHTNGIEVACAAVARGARIIEKHFTLDHTLPGPDHQASLEPAQLTDLVRAIRNIEQALGDGRKGPTAAEADTGRVARRSLTATCALDVGDAIRPEHVVIKRPGTGMAPADMPLIVGRRLQRPIQADEQFTWDHLGPQETP